MAMKRCRRWAERLLPLLFILGASSVAFAASSGFQAGGSAKRLPQGVPHRVAIGNFSGPEAEQVGDDFFVGVMRLGFEVIEREHFNEIAAELKLQQTGMISTSTVKSLGEHLGVEGMFIGKVHAQRDGQKGAYVGVRLVDVGSGKVLWSATGSSAESLCRSLADDLNLAATAKLPRRRYAVTHPARDAEPYALLHQGSIVGVKTSDGHRYTLLFDSWDDQTPNRLRFCFGVPPCPIEPFSISASEIEDIDLLSN